MKKTLYFTSPVFQMGQIKVAIDNVDLQKSSWMEENSEFIGKIDFEDIKFINFGQVNNQVIAVIVLTYYPK